MEAGSCWFLPRLVGMQQAQEWVMTAELFGADEALKGGLVRSVHAPEELLPAAQALARKFAASTSSSVAAAVNRRLMWSMLGAQDPLDAVTLDLQCVGYLAAGADAQEGIKSFFEKRAPAFPLKPSEGHAALRAVDEVVIRGPRASARSSAFTCAHDHERAGGPRSALR